MTSAPSVWARRAVSSPMPALPPINTTVCPASSGPRPADAGAVALVLTLVLICLSSRRQARHLCVPRSDRLRHLRDLHAQRGQGRLIDPREAGEGLDPVTEH